MTPHPVIPADAGRDPAARRWSPAAGYGLALGVSLAAWSALILGVAALT